MLLALLLQAAGPMPPADWRTMPELPAPASGGSFDPSPYVQREVAAGRCRATTLEVGFQVDAPVAVLIDAAGTVRRVVPQAIGCPTVEQYTVGLVTTLARRSLPGPLKPGWYRYVATYRWAG